MVQTAPPRIGLDKARNNVLWDLDETVPQVDVAFFFDNLLPPSPLSCDMTAEDVVATLKDKGVIVKSEVEVEVEVKKDEEKQEGVRKQKRGKKQKEEPKQKEKKMVENWRGWGTPSATDGHEDKVFAPFAELTASIEQAAGITDRPPTISFRCNPAVHMTSKTRNNTSKPDCCGICIDAELEIDDLTEKRQPRWLDVAIPGEFKKFSGEIPFSDVSSQRALKTLMSHLLYRTRQRLSGP